MSVQEKAQSKAIANFEKSIQSMIDIFCHKHDTNFDYAVGDDLTGVLCFGDNFFNIGDVYLDLKENKPKGLIFEWQNYLTDHNIRNNVNEFINFSSYCIGARFEEVK